MTKRILVIDDHSETLRLTTLILARKSYEVDTAQSGQAGIDAAKENVPDLVLLDIMMPEMSGLEVCRVFRADPQLQHVPIMMFTARAQTEDQTEAYDAGANEYVVKPTRPQELLERVQTALEVHSIEVEPIIEPTVPPVSSQAPDEDDDSQYADEDLAADSQPVLAILGATEDRTGYQFVALNLSAELATIQPDVTLLHLTHSSGVEIAGVKQLHARDCKNQLMTTIAEAAAENVVVIKAGNSAETLPTAILEQITDLIVCFSPDLISISQAQDMITLLEPELSGSAEIHAVMLDFSGSISVPVETATTFLKYPIIAAIPIEPSQFEQSLANDEIFIQSYADTEASQQIKAIAQKLISLEHVR